MGKGMNKTIPIHVTSAVACPSTAVQRNIAQLGRALILGVRGFRGFESFYSDQQQKS